MPPEVFVELGIADGVEHAPDEEMLCRCVTDVVVDVGHGDAAAIEVSVRVVGEAEARALNLRFRNVDKATNVLSFPADRDGLPPVEARMLGDIVLCAPVIEQEAVRQGKPVQDHYAHLIVHGALHLFGFDHETDSEAQEMEALETRLLAVRGIADPYA